MKTNSMSLNIHLSHDDTDEMRAIKIMNAVTPIIRSIGEEVGVDPCDMMSAMIIYGYTQMVLNEHNECAEQAFERARKFVSGLGTDVFAKRATNETAH